MPPSMRMFKYEIIPNYRSNSRVAKESFAVASKKKQKNGMDFARWLLVIVSVSPIF